MKDLTLRRGADRRVRGGHLWVYSNEIETRHASLSEFAAGDTVQVKTSDGALLGSAYMEPNSLICARLYAPGQQTELDQPFFTARLIQALAVRERAFDKPFYRLVYGDSDFLPGVVIDRFGDIFVVQLNNAGMERYSEALLQALIETLAPTGVLLRNDSRARKEQGIAAEPEVIFGEVPEEVLLEENGVQFLAPVIAGQKTGWFYDHRMSRAALHPWVQGKSVLDVYSYIGGWGVQAATFGAQSVCCLDSSATALASVERNAQLNGVSDRVATRRGSADEEMKKMADAGERFDVVVLDPPAFIPRRKDLKKGIAAYRRINELGLRLLKPGGLLVAGSCSMHLARSDLIAALQQASVRKAVGHNGAQLGHIAQREVKPLSGDRMQRMCRISHHNEALTNLLTGLHQ